MDQYRVTVNGISYSVEIEMFSSEKSRPAPINNQSKPAVSQSVQTIPKSTPQVKKQSGAEAKSVQAPMQGKIISVNVTPGQDIVKGDVIAVLEAMKMENEIMAAEDATVEKVNVTPGQSVEAGDSIVSLS